jgi:hypothetical protein
MKVIHSIELEDAEVQALFELARKIGETQMTATLTEDEKVAIISTNTTKFTELLDSYVHDSFNLGLKSNRKSKK